MGDKYTYSQVSTKSDIEISPEKATYQMTKMPDPERNALQQKVKKWEVFPGRNKFCCDGRLMVSTQTGIFYFTLFLIIATSAAFFALDSWYLWINVSPILPILAAVQVVFVCVVLCRTACGDPGVIPRASPAEAEALEKLIEQEQNVAAEQSKGGNLPYRPPPRIREVTVRGKSFKLKYCYTCKIFRPPRASHCSVCDNCVDRFDHHCPWVGNCVGRRNYKYFFLFLASLTVYCAYLLALSVTALVLRTKAPNSDFQTAMREGPLSPVVALVAFFSIWSVAGLAGFHSYLTAHNMTTNEDIKGTFKESNGGNPFSSGSSCKNCAIVLCGPLPPSLIDRRGWVTEHDVPSVVTQPPTVNGVRTLPQSTRANSVVTSGATASPLAVAASNRNKNNAVGMTSNSASNSAQSNNSQEAAQINNGKPYPVQQQYPPKYLPPIDHHRPSAAGNGTSASAAAGQSREYLT